jgi:rSAM/selenodomain-associated transferase 1
VASQTTLGLFAKLWDPGGVKTRLAKTLGDDAAAKIYFELLTFHLQRFAHSADSRWIAYSPDTEIAAGRFTELTGSLNPNAAWQLVPQVESDLGMRMSEFFRQRFDATEQVARIVVIGSDAPGLTTDIVDEAYNSLRNHDVVFGPSTDGGYYLIGLSVMEASIFKHIDWSTEKVLSQSLKKCEAAGLSVAQLEPLTDIDTEEDLVLAVNQLRESEDDLDQSLFEKISPLLRETQS